MVHVIGQIYSSDKPSYDIFVLTHSQALNTVNAIEKIGENSIA